jgi:hypothetical protein
MKRDRGRKQEYNYYRIDRKWERSVGERKELYIPP